MEHQFKPTNVWLASVVEAAGYRIDYPPNTKWMETAVDNSGNKRFIRFGLWEDWVVAYTHILDLPNAGPGRVDLLSLALRLNDVTGMGKYVLNDDWIALEVHHPAPHLTPDNIARIFAGLQHTASQHQPEFLKVQTAGSNLDALERAFWRPQNRCASCQRGRRIRPIRRPASYRFASRQADLAKLISVLRRGGKFNFELRANWRGRAPTSQLRNFVYPQNEFSYFTDYSFLQVVLGNSCVSRRNAVYVFRLSHA